MSKVLIYEIEGGQRRVDMRLAAHASGNKALVMFALIKLMADDPRLGRAEMGA